MRKVRKDDREYRGYLSHIGLDAMCHIGEGVHKKLKIKSVVKDTYAGVKHLLPIHYVTDMGAFWVGTCHIIDQHQLNLANDFGINHGDEIRYNSNG